LIFKEKIQIKVDARSTAFPSPRGALQKKCDLFEFTHLPAGMLECRGGLPVAALRPRTAAILYIRTAAILSSGRGSGRCSEFFSIGIACASRW